MDISNFLRKTCVFSLDACYLLGSSVGSGFGHIPLNIYHRKVRFANVCVKMFADGHALKYLQSPRSDKNEKKGFPTETPDRFWPFCRPVVGGDTCSSLASILGPAKKMWPCHPL